MKKKLIITLLALHLIIMYMGTSMFSYAWIPEALREPVFNYLCVTGGHSYNFFSPDIPVQFVVKCDITDSDGRIITETFDQSNNTFGLRMTYVFQTLTANGDADPAVKIASNYCFMQYPHAKYITVYIYEYKVPTIEEYKAGMRPTLSELYNDTVSHE